MSSCSKISVHPTIVVRGVLISNDKVEGRKSFTIMGEPCDTVSRKRFFDSLAAISFLREDNPRSMINVSVSHKSDLKYQLVLLRKVSFMNALARERLWERNTAQGCSIVENRKCGNSIICSCTKEVNIIGIFR
jgi:hypothetical protein